MVSPEPIVIEKFAVAVCAGDAESVTVTTTLLLVPAAVGVPLMTPVEALIVNPAGWPLIDHVYAPVPPVATTAAL